MNDRMGSSRWRVSLLGLGVCLGLGACASAPQPAATPVVAEPAVPAASAPVAAPPPDTIGDLIGERSATAAIAPIAPSPVAEPVAPPARTALFPAYLERLRAESCPAGVRRETAEPIELTVASVPLSGINRGLRRVGALTYVGGFHLDSPDERFGGLSGLDLLPDGRLLAVSDQGDIVWIDLAADSATPKSARIAALRDASGDPLSGKADGDAEGLAYNDGVALVSFERNHRVLAYDLERCGSAARGAPIVSGGSGRTLERSFDLAGMDVSSNQGPEPLAVTPDWYMFTGVETLKDGRGPLSARPLEAAPEFTLSIERNAPAFVGLDVLPAGKTGQDVRAFSVHRGFDNILGNAITLSETYFERVFDQAGAPARIVSDIEERARYRFRARDTRRLAEMSIVLTIDNFESIAARAMPDGSTRLYILSDDNFAARQRTLLMVFDLPPA